MSSIADGRPGAAPNDAVASDPLIPVYVFCARGFPGSEQSCSRGRYMRLSEALTRFFYEHMYFSAYSTPELPPRLKNAVFDHGYSTEMVLMAFDVDRPRNAGDEWFATTTRKIEALLAEHPDGYWYRTENGFRLVFRLPSPMRLATRADARAWSLLYVRNICYLKRRFDIEADPSCKNFGRGFAVPHTLKPRQATPLMLAKAANVHSVGLWLFEPDRTPTALTQDLCLAIAMRAVRPTQWDKAEAELRRAIAPVGGTARPRRVRVNTRVVANGALPADVVRFVDELVAPMARIADGRHEIYNALSGALVQRGFDAAVVVDMVRMLATKAGDPEVERRVADARSTANRFDEGVITTGLPKLYELAPDLAAVVLRYAAAVGAVEQTRRRLMARPRPELVPLEAAGARLAKEMRRALKRKACTVFVVTPGAGKSATAIDALIARKRRAAFVAPTNLVVKEVFERAAAADRAAVQRRTGVLGVLDDDGRAICKHEELVKNLQRGGQRAEVMACQHCPERDGCDARRDTVRKRSAPVLVTNAAMGRSALRHTARRRPIVVDEPPPACLHSTINAKALTDLRDALWEGKADPEFKRRSELLLSMVQQAMRRGIAATSMRDLLNQLISSETKLVARGGVKLRYIDHVKLAAAKIIALEGPAVARGSGDDAPDTDDEPWFDSNDCVDVVRDAVRLFRRAVLRSPSKAPSLLNHGSTPRARMPSPCEAARLGSLGETVRALMAATRVSSRWSTTANGEFETTSVNARAHCLLQSSRIVVLDATPDLDALRVVRPDAHVVHLDVADGAPCTRTLLYWGKGARRFLVPSGAVDEALLADALVHTLRRLPVDCRNVLIVTHMPVADHLRNKRYRAPALQSVVREYERRGEFRIEHYGRIEGRNTFEGLSWSDLDAVVTIGDPWPNVDSVAREVRVLRLKTTPSERLQHLAEAELAQAHGRLRAPRRTRPGTMIHVGRVIPLGWHGGNTTVDGLSWGRPRGTSHMDAQELEGLASRAGGWRALARAARVSPRSLRKYRNGICSVSASIAAKLRSAVG